jgi:uncharacterized membrane protein HdeD (DUF308 family)
VAPDSSEGGNLRLFVRHWWTLLLRGLIAIIFGLLAFTWPGLTARVLVLMFGLYALSDGIFCLVSAAGSGRDDRWLLVLEGIVGLWAGLVMLRSPSLTAVVLIFLMSIWAMATGVLRLAAAFRLRRAIPGEFWLAFSGILGVLFALLLMFRPGIGALSVVWIIGAFALAFGLTEIVLGVELRRIQHAH